MWLRTNPYTVFTLHFCLFPVRQEHFRGTQFSSDNDVIQFVEDFLQEQDALLQDWNTEAAETMKKCVEVR